MTEDNDLITCRQCTRLRGEYCIATTRYRPMHGLQRRCEHYHPMAGDADQRTGLQRWPGLAKMARLQAEMAKKN